MQNSSKRKAWSLFRLGLLPIAVACIASSGLYTSADELVFDDVESKSNTQLASTIQPSSNVRRAVTPSNRTRAGVSAPGKMSISQRSSLQIQVEPSNDRVAPSRLIATQKEAEAPIPEPHVESVLQPKQLQVDSVLEPEAMPPEPQYDQEWAFTDHENVSCDCGMQSCDVGCDSMSCNVSSCDAWACGDGLCFPFLNPLHNPVGFACSVLNRMQFRVTYVNFWKNDATLPVLAQSTGAAPTTLFGGGAVLTGSQDGVRGDITYWIDSERQRALWLRLYDTNDQSETFNSNNRAVQRPFNAAGSPFVITNGTLNISLNSMFEGGDLLVRHRLREDDLVRTDLLWGYQQIRFVESLGILTTLPGPPGALIDREFFEATNQFNGGQIGIARSAHDGCWYFDGFAKLGFGNMNRQVAIDGSTNNLRANALFVDADTNVGRFENETFVFTPEFGINAGYLLTKNLHFVIGYSFLRVPKVSRVQDALPPGLVTSRVDNRTVPAFRFVESNLTVQMLDLGIQYRY